MKKIQILKVVVEVSLIGLVIIALLFLFKLNPWIGRFNQASEMVPRQDGFDWLKFFLKMVPVFTGIIFILPMGIYFSVLWMIRRILLSILEDSLFAAKQVATIKKIAGIFLVFTGVIFVLNLTKAITMLMKGPTEKAIIAFSGTLASSLGYLIISLIAYILAEIFLVGMKLKEESELTV